MFTPPLLLTYLLLAIACLRVCPDWETLFAFIFLLLFKLHLEFASHLAELAEEVDLNNNDPNEHCRNE
ncbi:hypothetical protein AVEN_96770-1 [Araneus ventricosus]|uniref:Uncharacterized protein n=1 Tax=Araneus ventricosus TaxID=182803 RepID=A0A4Y2IML0_ARAVE|nr:hypothetical protein AVEN_96770-1 [Araneus ventricosus]